MGICQRICSIVLTQLSVVSDFLVNNRSFSIHLPFPLTSKLNMEALGAAASIIAIIQLTGTVTKLCHEYLGGATGATKDMLQILNELYALKGVFEWLESRLKSNQGTNTSPRTSHSRPGTTASRHRELVCGRK